MQKSRAFFNALLCAAAVAGSGLAVAAPEAVDRIMNASCGGCHSRDDSGNWSRVSGQRKTPEGWHMTLVRMELVHGARIHDPEDSDSDAMRTLVKYLADTQGLAPGERAPAAFVLERRLNTIEDFDSQQFQQMCARCHTGARVALQRRSADEWRHLVHFHLGQFPTTEYQLMGRDRDWLGIALNEMVPHLAQRFPLDSSLWSDWQAAAHPALAGRWRVAGGMPGRGLFKGYMTAVAEGGDRYRLSFTGVFDDGTALEGDGDAVVYTGYEWRGSVKLAGEPYRQVFAAGPDGDTLQGRMFQRDHEEWGLAIDAVRETGAPRLLALQPAQARAGGRTRLEVIGADLGGAVNLGPGVAVADVVQRDNGHIVLEVEIPPTAAEGPRDLRVGDSILADALTVYRSVDRVAVEPGYAIARVGGDGGSQPRVEAIFQAIGWSDGADGEPGTADDLRIGPLPATWAVGPWDARAEQDRDVHFAGAMDTDAGVFTPAAAGPNPERQFSTNNAGNLEVTATVEAEQKTLTGSGHLIVTVQRWNNPPIR